MHTIITGPLFGLWTLYGPFLMLPPTEFTLYNPLNYILDNLVHTNDD